MDKRTFLGLVGGAAFATGAFAAPSSRAKLRIGVVGGGIMGASIAMHCARAGADVTLMEKTAPASGATSKSFAHINPFSDDAHYTALRLASMARWQALDVPLGMGAVWGGYVNFTDKPDERGRWASVARQLAATGHPARALDLAALLKIGPELAIRNLVEATWSDLGGHVDAIHATRQYLAAATKAGARVIFPCPVTSIEPVAGDGGGVNVVTPKERFHFDHVIVASGVDAPAMLAPLGYKLPLLHRPGAIMHSKPLPIMTRVVYDGPGELTWKQMANGSIVGEEASGPPPIAVHAGIRDHVMAFPPGIAEMHGARIISKLAVYVPKLATAELDFMTLGFRPLPVDGFPVVGPVPGVPGVSLCVTHSGITLSAGLGAFMASEVIMGHNEPLLSPYRPDRVFNVDPSAR